MDRIKKAFVAIPALLGSNDIMGDKYRRPETYGILADVNVKGIIGGKFVH